jgi:hypothetical protein
MGIKPFDHVGESTVSHNLTVLPKDFKPHKSKEPNKFFYEGSVIGKTGSQNVKAHFNGYLYKDEKDKVYKFREVEKKFTLLSGAWGTIEKVKENKSALLKTRTKDVIFVASTDAAAEGELIVFPNPSEMLQGHYLQGFTRGAAGKIVYAGDYVEESLVKEAYELGVGALLVGSASKRAMTFAKSNNMSFGIFGGFGQMKTPQVTYDFLLGVSNRFVFFHGERNILRVPLSPDDEENKGSAKKSKSTVLRYVRKGLTVLVLQKPHFGKVGKVDSVSGYSIFVKFEDGKEPVEVKLPNLLALE